MVQKRKENVAKMFKKTLKLTQVQQFSLFFHCFIPAVTVQFITDTHTNKCESVSLLDIYELRFFFHLSDLLVCKIYNTKLFIYLRNT